MGEQIIIRSFVEKYLNELSSVCNRLPMERFETVVNILNLAYEKENQIFVMGNGGSAATASHFACDINKGVSYCLGKRFKVICLNDNIASLLAYANDTSYEFVFVEQLKNFMQRGDVVLGISCSGNSANVINAISYGNENGATTIGFTGFDGGMLGRVAHIPLIVPIKDMRKVEDIHLIITHMISQLFYEKLKSGL